MFLQKSLFSKSSKVCFQISFRSFSGYVSEVLSEILSIVYSEIVPGVAPEILAVPLGTNPELPSRFFPSFLLKTPDLTHPGIFLEGPSEMIP